MNDVAKTIDEARGLLDSGDEVKATRLLTDALDATHDPELLRQIHELAVQGHERSGGLHKIHWHELMLDSAPEEAVR